jgi:hypothetical protein
MNRSRSGPASDATTISRRPHDSQSASRHARPHDPHEYDAHAEQWVATFDDRLQVAFGGSMPAIAIRRLLEGTEAAPDAYALICDADLSGSDSHTIHRSIVWRPPELLLPCGDCQGRGEYVGLLERETCGTCGGRKMVPV